MLVSPMGPGFGFAQPDTFCAGPRFGVPPGLPGVASWVERFNRRGTEPNELFRSEFGQNSWNPKKTTKNHFIEVACDPKYKKGPEKRETNCLEAARRTTLSHQFK